MYLVGVLGEDKKIIDVLERETDKLNVDFIDLDLNVIENFKNIKFDIILISNIKKYKKNEIFNKILSNSLISVVNTDVKDNLQSLESLKGIVITYGFNSKATITVSSVNDSKISVCIQRTIENINKKRIEPIEYVENYENIENIEISDVLGIKTIEKLLEKKKN